MAKIFHFSNDNPTTNRNFRRDAISAHAIRKANAKRPGGCSQFCSQLDKRAKGENFALCKIHKNRPEKVYRMLSGEDKDQLPARWSICEDEKLIELSAKKVSQKQIANILQRTENGVCGRLYKLRNQKTGK